MSDEDFSQLGATEKFTVEQFKKAFEGCLAGSRKLAESFEAMDISNIEQLILDTKTRETIVSVISPLQKLEANIQLAELYPLVLGALFKAREGNNA